MTIGKKYTLTFHQVNNADGPPWTFTSVVDSIEFTDSFTYDASFIASTVVATKYPSSPATAYYVTDTPPGATPAVDPDPTHQNEMVIIADFLYLNGAAPAPTAVNIGAMVSAAKTAAGL